MEFDYTELKQRIKQMYGSQEAFAEELHLEYQSLRRKLNNIRSISTDDILIWSSLLLIPENEIKRYFLTKRRRT